MSDAQATRPGGFRLIARLAARDMAREPVHVFCIVALIAGVVAPLMLLLAVKTGVMEGLIGALRDNPNMRRVDIIGDHDFGDAELARLRGWPELSFAAPEERAIARRIEGRAPDARAYRRVALVSSGLGDPLLPDGLRLGRLQIAVSAPLAERFDLRPGAVLETRATRGQPPTARMRVDLEVAHVLPRGWLQGDAALANHDFVSRVEAFYDDYALPEFDAPQGRDLSGRVQRYEGFRIFAADISQVAALEARLEREFGVTVNSRVAEIAPLLRLDADVGVALNVLAICAAAGLAAALTALFWASVERKRRTLSMLALMGAKPLDLALFPLTQALLYALGGGLAAVTIFLAGAASFNSLFAADIAAGGAIAPIRPAPLALICAGLAALALAAAALAAWRAFRIDPAAPLREEG